MNLILLIINIVFIHWDVLRIENVSESTNYRKLNRQILKIPCFSFWISENTMFMISILLSLYFKLLLSFQMYSSIPIYVLVLSSESKLNRFLYKLVVLYVYIFFSESLNARIQIQRRKQNII